MLRVLPLPAPCGPARGVAQHALSFLFVLSATFFMNIASLSQQTRADTPQENVSANADDLTQDSGSVKKIDSSENDDEFKEVRLVRRDGALSSLETSVVDYKGEYKASDGVVRNVTVDLIGAVHIAEGEYYEELNKLFQDYETVVFELVTDSDDNVAAMIQESRNKKEEKRNLNPLNFISYFQEDAGKFLRLSHQIDGIDYSAPNLRRGDCSTLELIGWTLSNGDVVDFLVELFAQSFLDSAPGSTEGAIVSVLCSKDKRLAVKRLFALELVDSSLGDVKKEYRALKQVDGGAAEPRESALIHLRNKKAIDVVRQELDAGHTRVALFFGAAHLPDLGRRLESDFGLTRQSDVRWFKAWNLESLEQ